MTVDTDIVVSARGLRRSFRTLEAVRGVDVEIRRGEVFGFLGPNGAGKSTLIRMLMGLLDPSAGEVEILGFQLPRQAEQLRPYLGYMPQSFSLYQDLSVRENLEFAGEIFGLDPRLRKTKVAEALTEHELEERASQRAGSLSGGWRQLLALAVATIHDPPILLLDEPTAGVDPDRRRSFWRKLFELAGDGTTVLVSTHYMDEAIRCHRLCMMREGRRVALGRPLALMQRLAGRVLELVATPIDRAASTLESHLDVLSVAQLGSRARVLLGPEAPPAEHAAGALRTELIDAGLEVESIVESEPGLEEVFVALALGEALTDEDEA